MHLHDFVLGRAETDDPLVAAGDAGFDLFGGQGERGGQAAAHGVVVGEGFAAGFGIAAQGLQLLGRIEGIIGPSVPYELAGVLEVEFPSLALPVGGVGASDSDPFVDFDAAPGERAEDVLLGSRHETLGVGVLDAQDHGASVFAGEQVVIERGADPADMQRSRGAGCEAHPDRS